MNKRIKRIITAFMVVVLVVSNQSFTMAATFRDINKEEVFLKQAKGSKTCTLVSAVMLLRRTAMMRGDSDWSNITEEAVKSTAWSGGLLWDFTYKKIRVCKGDMPGGTKNADYLISLLKEHPEGIVIYDADLPHAILITDYTDGSFYYADPASSALEGRNKLTGSERVKIDNLDRYWYVVTPDVQLDSDSQQDNPDDSLDKPDEDTATPIISDVQYLDVTSSGYTVTCTVTDDLSGVAKVQFPTWIGTNPYENDGSWMTSAKCAGTISGNTVTYRVNTSDYGNKTGTYNTHIYAWDNSGNMAGAYQLKIKVPAYPAKSITVSPSGRVYTGNACEPAITVKDTVGKVISASNYSVTYANNVNVGTATVKVTFNGKIYTGSLSQKFTITKANNKITGTTSYTKVAKSTTQSFTLNAKATGGKMTYKSNNKNATVNSAGKVTIAKNFSGKAIITVTAGNSNYKTATRKITITVKPAAVSLKSVKNSAKGQMKTAWTSLSYVSGYQVQYSTSSTFKSGNKAVTVSRASNTGNTISGITKGKTYYVRVRAYKTIDGNKVFGAWSVIKSVKISK